jgi:two-component system cell cycle sensor histidine kinase/response regulator CckA
VSWQPQPAVDLSTQRFRDLVEELGPILIESEPGAEAPGFVSRRAEAVLGYPCSHWLQSWRFWFEHIHPDDREHVVSAQEQALAQGHGFELEYRMLTSSGRVAWIRHSARLRHDPATGRRILSAMLTDVTEERQRQDELERSLALLRATLDATADGILVVDERGAVAGYNRKFVEMWDIPESVLAQESEAAMLEYALDRLVDPEAFASTVQALAGDAASESLDLIELRDGRCFERYSKPQRIGRDGLARVWSFRDVTEALRAEEALRRNEEQLQRSQRMEAVGRLAGGVAHDFNNLLTAINGYSDFLVSQLDQGSPLHRDAVEIQRAAQRAAALTNQLLAFSRRQVLQPRIVSLNSVVSDVDALLQRLIGEDIRLETIVDPQLGSVRADPGQLEQVIVNLAVNARDAMPAGGKLTIETRAVTLRQELAAEGGRVPAGSYAVLAVSDTGVGISPEVRPHLFEPFFTTKEPGKGTGLGLATAFGIVKQSGGEIVLESSPGAGASFQVYLPVVAEPHREQPPARRPPVAGPQATILLVEDEEMVRALVRQVLEREGYGILEAGDGPAALRLARSHEAGIDLLLTDVVMPQMSGYELAKAMTELQPELRVLFTSGYANEAIVSAGRAAADCSFIGKPFSPDDLAAKVRELLERPPAADAAGADAAASTAPPA